MIVSVASGKGGTGKTTVAVSLAKSMEGIRDVILLDCDVEDPNCHIFMHPQYDFEEDVHVMVPEVDINRCTLCGRCQEVCLFNAISVTNQKVFIFPELCHSCRACVLLCPHSAMKKSSRPVGVIQGVTESGLQFVHGKMNIGEISSTGLIDEVKRYADKSKFTIVDCPAGTACPMVESVKGSDFCVLVTEPTAFGLNDLKLAWEVTKILKIPSAVIINRSDIGDDRVRNFCKEHHIPIYLEIPNDRTVAEGYSRGKTLPDILPKYKEKFREIVDTIESSKV